ncbi:MAG: hypothetical protein K9K62_10815 [Desulfobacteraceae bacterium]|nr:hypothetical protein [Desulfobacteraceae bacterium]
MTQRKHKPSFDAMIRLFIQKYDIATKKEINRLARKIEDLEKRVSKPADAARPVPGTKKEQSAGEVVRNVIKDMADGATVTDIKAQTGYDDKKVRNILQRLSKQGRIRRKKRGVYLPAEYV